MDQTTLEKIMTTLNELANLEERLDGELEAFGKRLDHLEERLNLIEHRVGDA